MKFNRAAATAILAAIAFQEGSALQAVKRKGRAPREPRPDYDDVEPISTTGPPAPEPKPDYDNAEKEDPEEAALRAQLEHVQEKFNRKNAGKVTGTVVKRAKRVSQGQEMNRALKNLFPQAEEREEEWSKMTEAERKEDMKRRARLQRKYPTGGIGGVQSYLDGRLAVNIQKKIRAPPPPPPFGEPLTEDTRF
ncbi:hypothetical protein FOZ63_018875 [Perkinsus olseni]|uniref:Uncharacterized protein n=1 Tax=Perkinsus olseni TaxID=32597 RepID=A0A7J6Q8L2_PEROL|nr:hypothetical protein FOZ63_018875 [Perkinsus olseni]KAF4744925.1 hypothetical protein FOZ62_022877 [Perkinsus olseni]